MTPAFTNPTNPAWFRFVWFLVAPLAELFASKEDAIGRRMLFLASERFPAAELFEKGGGEVAVASDGKLGGGAYSVRYDGETNDLEEAYKGYDRAEMRAKVWAHTMEVFEQVSAGRRFDG